MIAAFAEGDAIGLENHRLGYEGGVVYDSDYDVAVRSGDFSDGDNIKDVQKKDPHFNVEELRDERPYLDNDNTDTQKKQVTDELSYDPGLPGGFRFDQRSVAAVQQSLDLLGGSVSNLEDRVKHLFNFKF